MTITALPTAPQRTDAPATFITRADAWVAAIDQFTTEANALAVTVNADEVSAAASAAAAAVSAASASDSAEAGAAVANYIGLYSAQSGAQNKPASVKHLDKFWALNTDLVDITLKVPGTDVEWDELPSGTGSGGTTITAGVTLTKDSQSMQVITPTTWGEVVVLPDATTMSEGSGIFGLQNNSAYPVKIEDNTGELLGFIPAQGFVAVGLGDNSTAAGSWGLGGAEVYGVGARSDMTDFTYGMSYIETYEYDTGKTIMVLSGTGAQSWVMVYDGNTNTWGSAVSLRLVDVRQAVRMVAIDTSNVLVMSFDYGTTSLEGVVVSISGVTPTVNTADTQTTTEPCEDTPELIKESGGDYVLAWHDGASTAGGRVLGIDVTGTTVTIGTEYSLGTANTDDEGAPRLYDYGSGNVLALSNDGGTAVEAYGMSVSGGEVTLGTKITNSSVSSAQFLRHAAMNTGRAVVTYEESSQRKASIVSMAGTVPTFSEVIITTTSRNRSFMVNISATEMVVLAQTAGSATADINILTDTAGTASVGTFEVTASSAGWFPLTVDGTSQGYALFGQWRTRADKSVLQIVKVSASAGEPVVEYLDRVSFNGDGVSAPQSYIDGIMSRGDRSLDGTIYGNSFAVSVGNTDVNSDGASHAFAFDYESEKPFIVPVVMMGPGGNEDGGANGYDLSEDRSKHWSISSQLGAGSNLAQYVQLMEVA